MVGKMRVKSILLKNKSAESLQLVSSVKFSAAVVKRTKTNIVNTPE